MLEVVNYIVRPIDEQKLLIMLDFSKALDATNYSLLDAALEYFAMDVVKLLEVKNKVGSWEAASGVPQEFISDVFLYLHLCIF